VVIDERPGGPADSGLTRPVKLVVWDLDDTLWDGTLSEGPVTLDPSRVELVRTLNRRGIVNSVCSKNDPDRARAELERVGLWDELVFARIDWTPKGGRVAQIVADAQLRAEDVLFVDDLPLNREEVRHAVPGIQVAGPDIIDGLLDRPQLAGKDDRRLTRLEQYRVLERKLSDRQAVEGTNEAFLRSCDIRIGLFTDAVSESDRLFELVNRTNQLNFTKRRPDRDQFDTLLADTRRATGYVRVRDRYGDYGICGFFSLDPGNRVLTDFLFSCRILNMGVEEWLYDHLGRPSLDVVGEVASSVGTAIGTQGPVDWITRDDAGFVDRSRASGAGAGAGGPVVAPTQPHRVLMVGGCDLSTAEQFLGGDITTEFSHTGPTGAFIYVGHTETLRQSAEGIDDRQWALVDRIPFLDERVFRSPAVVDPDYDVLVYSVLTDYTQGLYRHRTTGLVVPWHHLTVDATRPEHWESIEYRFAREGMNRPFLQWFAEEFEFLGGVTVDRFQENIRWLARSVPPGAQLILLNGAEVPVDQPKEPDSHLHHRIMNAALDDVVAGLPNAMVCDVRAFVTGRDDLLDDIRHYRRHVYLAMAEEIRASGVAGLTVQPQPWSARAFAVVWGFAGRRKVEARRWWRKVRGLPPPRAG
jgi:FkbH-like protein